MGKPFDRSGRIRTRSTVPMVARSGSRKAKLLSPLVLSSLIQAISRIIVALMS